MSLRSEQRRKARKEKTRNRWTANENADRGGSVGVESCGDLAYSSTVARALAGVSRKAPTV